MTTETLKIAVVGGGAIAQLAHLPVLAKMRGVELTGIADNDSAKAQVLAERFQVKHVFTDMEDLLELDELDAVVVTTPNHLHEPHILSALRAKVHVLSERPLALSVRGVERILAAAERAQRKVLVANNYRFRTDVQALASFLRGGELGRLSGVRAGAYHARRQDEGWRSRRPESGGGAFLEHGLPLLDLALWLADFPQPVRLSATMDRGRGAAAVEDSMLVMLECAQNKTFAVDVNWAYVGPEERWWFEVIGSRGSARLSPLRVVKELNGRPTDVSPRGAAARESAFIQSYRAELAHFVAAVRGEVDYEPPRDQLLVHRIAEAIYRSAEDGKEVRL